MPTLAVFADVHANLFALDAVLQDLAEVRPDEVIVGGDLVGRGPQGSAVVRRVQATGWRGVRGNHEDYLIDFAREQVPPDWLTSEYWSATQWMAAELGEAELAYLDALPMALRSEVIPEALVVHGTPRSNREGIGTWTDDETLEALLAPQGAEVLLCAHTHRPLVKQTPWGLVVNVGSVGLPFNGDWRAQYALVTRTGAGELEVELRQVPYDRDGFLAAYEETGFLASGGFTSALLRLEVLHARPFLVPFLKWADLLNEPAHVDNLPGFLDFYDPSLSMSEIFARFEALADQLSSAEEE